MKKLFTLLTLSCLLPAFAQIKVSELPAVTQANGSNDALILVTNLPSNPKTMRIAPRDLFNSLISSNIPATNSVLTSGDGSNRVWSAIVTILSLTAVDSITIGAGSNAVTITTSPLGVSSLDNSIQCSNVTTRTFTTVGNYYTTNISWAGPTNVVDMVFARQYYSVNSAVQVTSITNIVGAGLGVRTQVKFRGVGGPWALQISIPATATINTFITNNTVGTLTIDSDSFCTNVLYSVY